MTRFTKKSDKLSIFPVFKGDVQLTSKAVARMLDLFKRGRLSSSQAQSAMDILAKTYSLPNLITSPDKTYDELEKWYEQDLERVQVQLKQQMEIIIETESRNSFSEAKLNVQNQATSYIQRNSDIITTAVQKARFFKIAYLEFIILQFFIKNSRAKPGKTNYNRIKGEISKTLDFYTETDEQQAIDKVTNHGNFAYDNLDEVIRQKQTDQSVVKNTKPRKK